MSWSEGSSAAAASVVAPERTTAGSMAGFDVYVGRTATDAYVVVDSDQGSCAARFPRLASMVTIAALWFGRYRRCVSS